MIELVFHARRAYPPVPGQAEQASTKPASAEPTTVEGAAESAEEARQALDGATGVSR
ncbi:MAG: hypothetical protein ACRDMI_12155 [Streptosporangiaceae bacterium]